MTVRTEDSPPMPELLHDLGLELMERRGNWPRPGFLPPPGAIYDVE